MNKVKALSNAVLMSVLMSTSVVWGTTAFAAENTPEYFLDTMVVTATRTPVEAFKTNANVSVITSKEIKERHYSDLSEALRMVPGVYIGNYAPAGYDNSNALKINGADEIVVLVDGVKINNVSNRVSAVMLKNMDNVDRIEVLKGSASTLYGSEASTGVINIITKKKMPNTLSLTKGEYGREKAALTLNANKLNFAVALEQSDPMKGYSSNYKQINDLNKKSFTASYKFDDNWSFSHQHNDSKYSYDQYDKTWSKLTEDANYHYIDDFSRLQYKDDSVSANLFYNRSNRRNQTYNVTGSKWTKSDHLRFDTIGLDLQKQITGKFGDVIVGTTVSRDSYKNDITVAKNIKPGTKINEFRTNYAVFAQMSKDLGAGYTATVGARETVVEANKRYNAFTPQFALLKKLDNNSSLYANAAKSFKMPTFTQIYGGGGANFAANPLLEPEEGWTYEFGYKKTSNTSMFKAALYYMDLDTIEYEGKGTSSNPYVTRNMSFKNKGLEMTYEKDFGSKYSYSLGANFCNPMGKNKKGVWERKFAREQDNAGIKYHDAKFNAALTGMFTTDRASGWGDLLPVNFIAGYKFDKSSSVELGVENIFDRDDIVSNPGSATKYYCLPRMVHVTYTYTF